MSTTLTYSEIDSFISLYESDLSDARKSLVEIKENSTVLTVRCVNTVETALLNLIFGIEENLESLRTIAATQADLHQDSVFPTAHKPAPSLGGSGAGLLEACLFPQPKHDSDPHSFVTGEKVSFESLREEFHTDAVCFGSGIDATVHIARGSVSSCSFGRRSWGSSTVSRPGTYA